MAWLVVRLAISVSLLYTASAVFEDQVGKFDWYVNGICGCVLVSRNIHCGISATVKTAGTLSRLLTVVSYTGLISHMLTLLSTHCGFFQEATVHRQGAFCLV